MALAEPASIPTAVPPATASTLPAVIDNTAADKILDRYIEVTGGQALYDAVKSRKIQGELSIPAQGITGSMTVAQKDEKTALVTLVIEGLGKVIQGRSGDTIFEFNGISNAARIVEGAEADSLRRTLSLDDQKAARDFFVSRQLIGREDVEGKPADKVLMIAADGTKQTSFYDVETGFAVKSEILLTTQMGEIAAMTKLQDYKAFDGILIPTLTRQFVAGQEIVIKINKVETNIELTDADVAPPESVLPLLKK